MKNKELILRILINRKTQKKTKYRTVIYYLLGMKITVGKEMSKKIDILVANSKFRILSNLIDNYLENIITNFGAQ